MTTEAPPLLQAIAAAKAYGKDSVLRPFSLVVAAGSTSVVVAPSGAGKTTLLALLGLLLDPTAGTILVQGRDQAALEDRERSALRNTFFGSVFQSAHLIGSLSVLDNVLVPARLAGRARSARASGEEWLDRLGLADRRHHLPHALSVGQKRRVSLARALVLRPAVVLADEPTNDLDEMRAGEVADLLFQLPREGFTLVVATHDRSLAARADVRWTIANGQVTASAATSA